MTEAILKLSELRVSVAVGAAVIVQTAAALLWSGSAAERLNALERKADAAEELLVRTARIEEQLAATRAQLVRIETKLEDGSRGHD
ncbi:MAG: hypothetical protein HXY21_09065 [Parvularculaceae bacterium]|nr:hypothetical protein [Parvularculaceae bacterium]